MRCVVFVLVRKRREGYTNKMRNSVLLPIFGVTRLNFISSILTSSHPPTHPSPRTNTPTPPLSPLLLLPPSTPPIHLLPSTSSWYYYYLFADPFLPPAPTTTTTSSSYLTLCEIVREGRNLLYDTMASLHACARSQP